MSHFNFSEKLKTCKLNLNAIPKSCSLCLSLPPGRMAPALHFSLLHLNLKAKRSPCPLLTGKARRRKGTEVKGVSTGGTHPAGDEQTVPRRDGKQGRSGTAGRAGLGGTGPGRGGLPAPTRGVQLQPWLSRHPEETSNPAGSRFETYHCVGLPRTPLYVRGGAGPGAAGFGRQPSSSTPAVAQPGTCRAPAPCRTPPGRVAGFKAQPVVAMSSLPAPRR